jgi:tetratricopeptide (TPR) repeat protein
MTPRIKYSLTAAALALAIGLPAAFVLAGSGEDARAAYERGAAALQKGDARTARIELLNAVKANPQWGSARLMQGQALLALGDGLGAEAEIARARSLGVAMPLTRHLMAQALLLQGRPEDALRDAAAGDADPRYRAEAERMQARAWQALGEMDKAAEAFGRMLKLKPESSRGWADIARFRLALGDRGGAVIAADRAARADPRNADAITLRGMLVRDQYGLRAAMPWFEKALAIAPNNVPALLEQAATAAELGQAGRMLALTRKALSLEPGNPRAYFMQAAMAARAGDYALARQLLQRTNGAMQDVPAVMLLTGILEYEAGSYTLAADRFGRLLARQPFNMNVRQLLGAAHYRAGAYQAAAQALQPLIERGDADSYSLALAARAHEKLGNAALATELLDRASLPVRDDATVFAGAGNPVLLAGAAMAAPDTAGAVIPYIRALLEAGDVARAIASARNLQQANRNAPAAHVLYGDALSAAGRPAEAIEAYKQAANLLFDEPTALRLVSAYRRVGDPARAMGILNLYLSQHPFSIEANWIAAAAHLEAGNWDEATLLLEALRRRIGNEDALLLSDLAMARLGKGQTAMALSLARRAYALQPSSPVASHIYGWARYKAEGVSQTSIDLLEKAVAISPRHPLLNLHLGEVYAKVGLKGRARQVLMVAAATQGFDQSEQAKVLLTRLQSRDQ